MSNGSQTARAVPELDRAIELAVTQPIPTRAIIPIGSAGVALPPPRRAIDILLNPRAWDMAERLAQSSLVPKQYQGRPADVLVAVAWGHSLGLDVMQSLIGIAVINGKPCMWGDTLVALCRAHGADVEEIESDDRISRTCTVTRPGQKPVTRSFSVDDAKRAGLWGKAGPWQSYPQRMLQSRARGFALRDACADILLGLIDSDEAQDYPTPEPERNGNARGRIAEAVGDREVVDRVHVGGGKAKAERPTHTRLLMAKAKAGGWLDNGGREKGKAMLESLGFESLDAVGTDDADRVAEVLDLGPQGWTDARYLEEHPELDGERDSLLTFEDAGGWSAADALRCLRSLPAGADLDAIAVAGPGAWREGGAR